MQYTYLSLLRVELRFSDKNSDFFCGNTTHMPRLEALFYQNP